jgi:hypothetical protein
MYLSLAPRLQEDTSGARYFGAPVAAELIEEYLRAFRRIAGFDRAARMTQAKAERDGADEYHVTIVSPPEYRDVDQVERGSEWSARVLGIGRQTDSTSETYFIVLSSPEVDRFRALLGLEPRHLHITLGFWPSDIYDRPKDAQTLIWTPGQNAGL